MLHGMLWTHLASTDTIILSALILIKNFVFDFKNLQFPMSNRGAAYNKTNTSSTKSYINSNMNNSEVVLALRVYLIWWIMFELSLCLGSDLWASRDHYCAFYPVLLNLSRLGLMESFYFYWEQSRRLGF